MPNLCKQLANARFVTAPNRKRRCRINTLSYDAATKTMHNYWHGSAAASACGATQLLSLSCTIIPPVLRMRRQKMHCKHANSRQLNGAHRDGCRAAHRPNNKRKTGVVLELRVGGMQLRLSSSLRRSFVVGWHTYLHIYVHVCTHVDVTTRFKPDTRLLFSFPTLYLVSTRK